MNIVQGLGQVDWDDFDNLQEVMTWMITIITFDQFIEPVEDAGWLWFKDILLRFVDCTKNQGTIIDMLFIYELKYLLLEHADDPPAPTKLSGGKLKFVAFVLKQVKGDVLGY